MNVGDKSSNDLMIPLFVPIHFLHPPPTTHNTKPKAGYFSMMLYWPIWLCITPVKCIPPHLASVQQKANKRLTISLICASCLHEQLTIRVDWREKGDKIMSIVNAIMPIRKTMEIASKCNKCKFLCITLSKPSPFIVIETRLQCRSKRYRDNRHHKQ